MERPAASSKATFVSSDVEEDDDMEDPVDIQEGIEEMEGEDDSVLPPESLHMQAKHVPICGKARWSAEELDILKQIMQHPNAGRKYCQALHQQYMELCRAKSIPDRSYFAFYKQLKKIRKHWKLFLYPPCRRIGGNYGFML